MIQLFKVSSEIRHLGELFYQKFIGLIFYEHEILVEGLKEIALPIDSNAINTVSFYTNHRNTLSRFPQVYL